MGYWDIQSSLFLPGRANHGFKNYLFVSSDSALNNKLCIDIPDFESFHSSK